MSGVYSWLFYSLYQLNFTETLILSICVLVYQLLYHYPINAHVYFIVIFTYIQIFDGLNIMYNVYPITNDDKCNKATNWIFGYVQYSITLTVSIVDIFWESDVYIFIASFIARLSSKNIVFNVLF